MTSKNLFSFYGARTLIVLFWLGVIFAFLFSPKVANIFRKERSITVFTLPLVLDAKYLKEFEKETGIKVYLTYYETNEELYGKLKSTRGAGYDILIPSDYIVSALIKDGLIKKIDKSKLNFFDRLEPAVTGQYHDPNNDYTLPYFWTVYGLGINKNYFGGKTPPPTWGLVFKKDMSPGRISMTNAPREAIMFAAHYLFGSINALKDPKKIKKIKELLIKQKEWVQVYTEARVKELLMSGACPVAVALAADVWRVKEEDNTDNIVFVTPKGGTFAVIDSFAVSSETEKDDLIYEFFNYFYRKPVVKHHLHEYGSCSPVIDVELTGNLHCALPEGERYIFFRPIVPEKVIEDIWIDLMAS